MPREIGLTVDMFAARNRKKVDILFFDIECDKYVHSTVAMGICRMILSIRTLTIVEQIRMEI